MYLKVRLHLPSQAMIEVFVGPFRDRDSCVKWDQALGAAIGRKQDRGQISHAETHCFPTLIPGSAKSASLGQDQFLDEVLGDYQDTCHRVQAGLKSGNYRLEWIRS